MTYQMGGTILSMTVKEKDLGVTMNANMIRRNITYKDKSLIVPLCKAIVRPHT